MFKKVLPWAGLTSGVLVLSVVTRLSHVSSLNDAVLHLRPKAKANRVMKVRDKNVSSKRNKLIFDIIFTNKVKNSMCEVS